MNRVLQRVANSFNSNENAVLSFKYNTAYGSDLTKVSKLKPLHIMVMNISSFWSTTVEKQIIPALKVYVIAYNHSSAW